VLLSHIHNRIDQLNRLHVILILAVLGLLAYANAVRHPFVHDDVVFIQANPYIHDLNLKNIFIQTSVPDDRFPLVNQYYRPLLELTNRILYRLVGFNPYAFHSFNILLHMINSFFIYNIICFVTNNKKGLSLAAAVLFLLHPVQNEAVACISGISNLIFTVLCLAGFYAYLVSMHGERMGKRPFLFGASLTLFFFALLAKEQSVILPFLILAYEACFNNGPFQETLKKYWRPIAGFFIVLMVYFLLRKMLFGFAITPVIDNEGELWVRVLAIPRSLLTYLGLIFFPHGLHYYRSQDILLPYVWPLIAVSIVIAAVIAVTCRAPHPQKKWMIFGLAWFTVSLSPTLNIIPLINEYSKILTAEHFLYFPLAGMLLFALGLGHSWVIQKRTEQRFAISFICFAVLTAVFTGYVMKQNTYWRGEIPLFERTLHYEKDFGRVRSLLAKAYSADGRFKEAIVEGRKALVIMQDYERKVSLEKVKKFYWNFIEGIRYHLGYCLDALGDKEGALAEFKEVLRLNPENKVIHYTLGLGYLKVNDMNNAITYFEKAVELNTNDLVAMNSLAICYQEVGRDTEAERLLRTIATKDRGSVSAQENLEKFLLKMGSPEAAP
jgi:tetratricopeptide (TPR) repeat protein